MSQYQSRSPEPDKRRYPETVSIAGQSYRFEIISNLQEVNPLHISRTEEGGPAVLANAISNKFTAPVQIRSGSCQFLERPAGYGNTRAEAVSDDGRRLIGQAESSSGSWDSFAWSCEGPGFTRPVAPKANYHYRRPMLESVNNRGVAVGACEHAGVPGRARGAIWEELSKGVELLDQLPEVPNSRALNINNAGVVCGYAYDRHQDSVPCVWLNGRMKLLPMDSDSCFGRALTISDSNLVVAFVLDQRTGKKRILAWQLELPENQSRVLGVKGPFTFPFDYPPDATPIATITFQNRTIRGVFPVATYEEDGDASRVLMLPPVEGEHVSHARFIDIQADLQRIAKQCSVDQVGVMEWSIEGQLLLQLAGHRCHLAAMASPN